MKLQADTARALMTPGPFSLPDTATAEQAAAFLTSHGFGAAVITDAAGNPVGVVTKTDLLIHARELAARGSPAGRADTVRGLMTEAVFSVREDAPAKSVVEQLLALNVHHLFVVDRGGTVVGVISPVDVIRKLA